MQTSQLDAVRPDEEKVGEVEESAQTFPVGSPRQRAMAQSVRDEVNREQSTSLESIGAAARTTTTANHWNAWKAPDFEPEADFDVVGRLNELPYAPSKDEERILRKAVSNLDFNYRSDNIQRIREDKRIAGDHPLLAFATHILDPAHLATDVLTLRMASTLRAGRIAAGLAAGASTASIMGLEYNVAPIDIKEVALGALLNAGTVTALYRTSRVARAGDVDIPAISREINGQVARATDEIDLPLQRNIEDGRVVETPNPQRVADSQKGAVQVPKVVAETAGAPKPTPRKMTLPGAITGREAIERITSAKAGTHSPLVVEAVSKLAAKLGNALDDIQVVRRGIKRSFYDPSTNTVHLRKNAPPHVVAHELAHAATAYKLRYGRLNPNTIHGDIARELEDIRKTAIRALRDDPNLSSDAQYYLGKGVRKGNELDEFVAGLFSGDEKFLRALANIEDKMAPIPGTTLLQSLWDGVRRILGLDPAEATVLQRALGITEKLLDTPIPLSKRSPSTAKLMAPEAPTAPRTTDEINSAVTKQLDSLGNRFGNWTAWNLHKAAHKLNPRIADLIFSNPLDQTKTSMSSLKRAMKADLQAVQFQMEDAFTEVMAARGFPRHKHLKTDGRALAAQKQLETDVAEVLVRRESAQRNGRPYTRSPDEAVEKIADAHQRLMDTALELEVRAGVFGSDNRTGIAGYFPRRWNPVGLADLDARFATLGIKGGREELAEQFARAIRTEGLDDVERLAMAKAILDRTRAKGDFSDSSFRGHMGNEVVLEIEDMLRRQGLSPEGITRVTDVLTGRVDEAGKASRFKARMDIDMTAELVAPDGTVVKMTDLMETDLIRLAEIRVEEASGSAAMAQMGVRTASDLGELRAEFIRGAKTQADKKTAEYLFDNGINVLMGRQVGEDMARGLRIMSAATQMVGLAYSGLWQVTEYAKMMSRYGLLRTGRAILEELPGFRNVASQDPAAFHRVLARNSYQDIRIRPFLSRLEDNFEIPREDKILQLAQHAKQYVPYLNGMVMVHRHQARVSGNLIYDSIERAARGDAGARRALSKYGMTDELLDEVNAVIKKHGDGIDAWPDGTWERIRDPLTKMIDDDVLRSKLGEIPAFAQFSTLGKFIFTFRSFVLGAHNKILAGTLVNEGAGGMALMLAYQLPLTMMMTQAASFMRGNGPLEGQEWAEAAFGQMGGLGLWADLSGVLLGNKAQFGAPGMIAADKLFRVANQAASGNVGGTAKAAISATPLVGITPFANAIHLLWE